MICLKEPAVTVGPQGLERKTRPEVFQGDIRSTMKKGALDGVARNHKPGCQGLRATKTGRYAWPLLQFRSLFRGRQTQTSRQRLFQGGFRASRYFSSRVMRAMSSDAGRPADSTLMWQTPFTEAMSKPLPQIIFIERIKFWRPVCTS